MRGKTYYTKEMMLELDALQQSISNDWLDKSLPEDWEGMDNWQRLDREKTRVTIRLDTDMVRWFRKLGPNYSRRINAILRIYWMALLSGHIHAHHRDNPITRIALNAHYRMLKEHGMDSGPEA